MVLNKSLRVFLLSVFVMLVAVSSAFAASREIVISRDNSQGNLGDYYYSSSSRKLILSVDYGIYSFSSSDVSIDTLVISKSLHEVTLILPEPSVNQPAQGTRGTWKLSFDKRDNANIVTKLLITRSATNAAILVSGDFRSFDIPGSYDVTIDVPFRTYSGYGVSLDVTVKSHGKLTFGPSAQIYGNASTNTTPTGYLRKASYDVEPYGTLVVQNIYALQGASLDVRVSRDATLVFDVSGVSEHDLKKAKLKIAGNFQTDSNLRLTNGMIQAWTSGDIFYSPDVFTKTGSGTLSLGTGLISNNVYGVTAAAGTLVFDGSPTWTTSNSLGVITANGGTVTLGSKSVSEGGRSIDIVATSGTVSLASHAIYKGVNEIYPYEDYKGNGNGMRIDVTNITANAASAGTIRLNGTQAFTAIKGAGTIEINGNAGIDDVVLLLISPDNSNNKKLNTSSFTGKIQGTNANLGLYASSSTNNVFSSDIFSKAASVVVDNLLVYNRAILEISGDTNIDFNTLWLRSNRPGANNNDAKIVDVGLNVGSVNFTNREPIELDGLKVDGTGYKDGMAKITLNRSSDVTISGLELYANREVGGTSKDFTIEYPNPKSPSKGIYALTIDSHQRAAKLTISGDTKGTGRAADVTDGTIFPVRLADSSDVKFKGPEGYYPIGRSNSLYAGENVKLEIVRGAIIDGNLRFAGSGNSVQLNFDNAQYPNDAWWRSYDQGYFNGYAASLDKFSVFTTQVGLKNRYNNGGGEYSVNVTGDITLSHDVLSKAGPDYYPGRVLVRVKPELDAFDDLNDTEAVVSTTLQRFMVLGTATGKYESDYATVKNNMFFFRVQPADTQGISVEVRNELAIMKLGKWYFVSGGDNYGTANGTPFEINIPYTIYYRGSALSKPTQAILSSNVDRNYYYANPINNALFRANEKVFFGTTYEDGEEVYVNDNVYDEARYTTSLSRSDINAEVITDVANQTINIHGTAYAESSDIDLALRYIMPSSRGPVSADINGIINAYRNYKFSREGTADDEGAYSQSKAEAEGAVDFTVSDDAYAEFTVSPFSEVTWETSGTSMPMLVDGHYVWNDGATSADAAKVYSLLNANGNLVQIKNIAVILYNGEPKGRLTTQKELDIEDVDITKVDDNKMSFKVHVSKLGDTGTALSQYKALSVKGTLSSGGTLETEPVTYTLHAYVDAADKITVEALNKSVTIGEDPISGVYNIDPDLFSGDVNFIKYDSGNAKWDWLNFDTYTGGYSSGFGYETGDLTGVEAGDYTFNVLAYAVGDNSAHKLYTFTVTVLAALTPHIAPIGTINAIIPNTATVTVTVADDKENTERTVTVTPTGSAPELTLTSDSATITGNGSVTYTLDTTELAEGTYSYTATAGTLEAVTFSIVVAKPPFEIVAIENGFDDAIDGHTYSAIFQVTGAEGEVTWSFNGSGVTTSELYTYNSGDMFVVEGVAKRDYDTTEEEDVEQVFIVSVTDESGRPAIVPEDGEDGYVPFTVEEVDEDITYTTEGLVLGADSSNEAVAEGYNIMFPTGVFADVDNVSLPSWLRPIIDDEEYAVKGVEFAGVAGDLANGATATVRVDEAYDEDGNEYYYGWDVTYAAEPPAFTITADSTTPAVTVGTPASVTFTPTNAAEGDINYSTTIDPIEGLTVDFTGNVATLTATVAGTYTVTVNATDAADKVAEPVVLTVTVTEAPTPGVFAIAADNTAPTLTVDTPARVTFTPTNAQGTVVYTPTIDPAQGLTVNFDGNVATLTATVAGTYTVTVNATDGSANAQPVTLRVTVSDVPPVEQFTITVPEGETSVAVTTGGNATATITPAGNDGDITYTPTVDPEEGLTVEFEGNVATFTATKAGTYTVTVSATDAAGRAAVEPVVFTVTASDALPTLTVTADPSTFTMSVGQSAAANLSTTNETGAVTYTASVDWVTINNETAVATVAPTAEGNFTVTITATDASGATARTTITVTVTATPVVGSSGGGCDAGFGALALLLAAPLFLRKRRS